VGDHRPGRRRRRAREHPEHRPRHDDGRHRTLGYWVDKDHLRRGLARAAVDFLGEQGLELGLHRLEAGTMVENVASQRVLEACGYEQFGMAPKLLFLNGAWRDHVLFQKLLHDEPLV
jgi:ribosomal-protein-alanine N-acetyltransferase